MKDYLGRAAWINRFPRNPTQTRYIRFIKQPGSKLTSQFDTSKRDFDKTMKDSLKTVYSEYLD